MTFCGWILSLNIMLSGFIHAVACTRTSFLYCLINSSIVWLWHILLFHVSVNGHLNCFHSGASVKSTDTNVHIPVFIWICFYFTWVYTPRIRIHVNSKFNLLMSCQTVFQSGWVPFSFLILIIESCPPFSGHSS